MPRVAYMFVADAEFAAVVLLPQPPGMRVAPVGRDEGHARHVDVIMLVEIPVFLWGHVRIVRMRERGRQADRVGTVTGPFASLGARLGAFVIDRMLLLAFVAPAAALYYVALLAGIHFTAGRAGITAAGDVATASAAGKLHLLLPLAGIVLLLAFGRSPMRAAFWGVALAMVVGALLVIGGLGAIQTAMVIGALPFIVIQFLAIMIVIFYPRLVTHYKDDEKPMNLEDVQIQLPGMGAPTAPGAPSGLPGLPGQNGGGLGLPGGLNLNGAPSGLGDQSGGSQQPAQPSLGLPGLPGGLNLDGSPPPTGEPAPAQQPDLSQPPPIQ